MLRRFQQAARSLAARDGAIEKLLYREDRGTAPYLEGGGDIFYSEDIISGRVQETFAVNAVENLLM